MAGRPWAPGERRFLAMHVPYWTVEMIARRLGRSPKSVRQKMERSGICPTRQHLVTSTRAAEILGYSPQWITAQARAGRIAAARRVPGGRWWLFDPRKLARDGMSARLG